VRHADQLYAALLCSLLLAACGSESDEVALDATAGPSRDAGVVAANDAAALADAADARADDSGGSPDSGGPLDSGDTQDASPAQADAGPAPLPTTRAEIVAFVQSGAYSAWAAEPARHASTGPHGGAVRTFVNDTLYTSLKQGRASHPSGSIAVKELYTGANRTGWAVDIKGDDGVWIYYEGFEPRLDQYYFRGDGNLCANCHAGGVDRVLVPASAFP
jgi:hypothetical protein